MSTPIHALTPNGYWEFRSLRLGGPSDEGLQIMRFRPSLKGDWGQAHWRITGEWDHTGSISSQPGAAGSEARIDRASLEWSKGSDTLRIGRQAINWGHGLLFNPTDPFRELFLTNVWHERSGVDGVRLLHSLGDNGGIIAAFATPDRRVDRRFAFRWFDSRIGFDRAFVYLRDPESGREKFGLDFKGDLGVSWWFEGIHARGVGESYDEWVVGLDYTFPWKEGFWLAVQRYSDGSGADRPLTYDWAGILAGTRRSLGRRYLVFNSRLTWNSNLSFHLDLVRNESDGTRILSPHVNWQYSDDRQIHMGVNLYKGPVGGEYRPGPLLDPFGRVPERVIYLWLRQHF